MPINTKPDENPIPFNPLHSLTGRELVHCADIVRGLFELAMRDDIEPEQIGLDVIHRLEHIRRHKFL